MYQYYTNPKQMNYLYTHQLFLRFTKFLMNIVMIIVSRIKLVLNPIEVMDNKNKWKITS